MTYLYIPIPEERFHALYLHTQDWPASPQSTDLVSFHGPFAVWYDEEGEVEEIGITTVAIYFVRPKKQEER